MVPRLATAGWRLCVVIPKTYGRMGNFLFQVAAAIAYAADHGLAYTVPTSTGDTFWNPLYLQHLVNSDYNDRLESVRVEEKREFHFDPIPFKEEWRNRNIILDGYWQNPGYFRHREKEVRESFGFRWTPKVGHVSIHVRRGDYLTVKRGNMLKHPTVTKQWISDQMDKFKDVRFVFFSDDLSWCEENFKRPDAVFHHGPSEVDDLVAMSWCEHHICSASTFSWWGAWLNRNPNKRIIVPKHWLTPGWNNHQNTEEIVPKEWERV